MTRVLKAERVVGVRHAAHERVAAELAAEQERQAAVAAAYAAGFDDGRAAALRAGADAGPRGAVALEQLLAHARQQHTTAVDATSRAVLAAAMDVAQWVLGHELRADSRSLLDRLAAATNALLPTPRTTVTVSPYDEEAVRAWAVGHDVEVAVDPALGPGDGRLDTGAGSVDVTVAAALRIAGEALGVDPARGPR